MLAKAFLEFKQHNKNKCLYWLKEALSLGRENRILFLDFFHPNILSLLFNNALIAKIEVEYVQEVIQRMNLIPNDLHLDNKYWPWPIKIFTLGRFSIQKDGKVLNFAGKVQKKPMLMLKLLISFGCEDISEEKLSDILWPDSDGDMAHKAFATTLHRLRKLLGNEKILKFQGKKLSLDPYYCWIDTMAFESILMQVDTIYEKENKVMAFDLIKNALALYHGHFMSNDEASWSILCRDRLKSKYIRNVEKLAEYSQETGQFKDAIECLRKAIEIDMLGESFYQQLMLCLKKSGQKAEALSVYQNCRNVLGTTLHIKPSPQTEIIYKSL